MQQFLVSFFEAIHGEHFSKGRSFPIKVDLVASSNETAKRKFKQKMYSGQSKLNFYLIILVLGQDQEILSN